MNEIGDQVSFGHPKGDVQQARITRYTADEQGKLTGVILQFQDGVWIEVPMGYMVEGLKVLSEQSGISEDTLRRAAVEGRLEARKSGATWLSTLMAVNEAVEQGKIRRESAKPGVAARPYQVKGV